MGRIVHRRLVQQDQVLIHVAAADIEARGAFPDRTHPRQQLNASDQIGLAHHVGNLLHLHRAQLFHAHLDVADILVFFLGPHDHLFHQEAFRSQFHIQVLTFPQGNIHRFDLKAQVAETNPVFIRRQGKRIEPVGIGGGAGGQFLYENIGADQFFAVGRVANMAAEGELFLGEAGPGRQDQTKRQANMVDG